MLMNTNYNIYNLNFNAMFDINLWKAIALALIALFGYYLKNPEKLENLAFFLSVKYDHRIIYWDDTHDMHIDQILYFANTV